MVQDSPELHLVPQERSFMSLSWAGPPEDPENGQTAEEFNGEGREQYSK